MRPDEKTVATLRLALEAEKESIERYLRFAWQTRDQGGKNMFIRLATDEYQHMRLLEKQEAAMCDSGECPLVEVPQSLVEQVLPRLRDKSVKIQGTSGQSGLSALNAALESENRARDFYAGHAKEPGSAPVQGMFLRLAEMEQAHADLLQAEIDNIQETGFWFSTREFTLETER